MMPLSLLLLIWAAWDLELGTHEPPLHFVLSVTSPTGAAVPPAMHIPWGTCAAVPGADYCAQVGCPPVGTFAFAVQAQYAEGLSAPSNIAICTIAPPGGSCVCGGPSVAPRPSLAPPARPPLRPLPPLPRVPAIPASAGT